MDPVNNRRFHISPALIFKIIDSVFTKKPLTALQRTVKVKTQN
jgi:hypothetical protein